MMQVSIENKSDIKRVLTVTVPADEVKQEYQKTFRQAAKSIRMDGFRKGHVPADIIESSYGRDILTDTYRNLIDKTLLAALKEKEVAFVGQPEISFEKTAWNKDAEFLYEATVEIEKVLEAKPLDALNLSNIKAEITDADIDKMIETLQKNQAKWQVKDDLAFGKDTMAKIDFLGRCDGTEFEGGKATDFTLNFNEDGMIPGFTSQIEGHKAGDKFTIQVKFPEEYHAENLKGKDAEFDITVNSVSESIKPEVNEDFIKMYGVKDGTMDAFRAELRKNMERELARAIRNKTYKDLFDALLKEYGDFEVPSVYVTEETKRLKEERKAQMQYYYGAKKLPESLFKDEMFKDEAQKNARLGIILRTYTKSMNMTKASDEYVEKELNSIVSSYEDPEEVKKAIRADKKQFGNIQMAAFEAQLVDEMMKQAAKQDQQMSFDELINQPR
ncbi:MAG: trigger factor [Succinivibrio sp.]|nr:trigger factor [Succinivibrio sp.]